MSGNFGQEGFGQRDIQHDRFGHDPAMQGPGAGIPGAYPPPQQRGWWARNWLWFTLSAFLVMALLCGGCCLGLFSLGMAVLRSEPYPTILARVQKDPRVIAKLGEPIEPAFFVQGTRETHNNSGRATVHFDVHGPRGSAAVDAEARMVGGSWGVIVLTVAFANGERLDLGGGDAPGENDAPPFRP